MSYFSFKWCGCIKQSGVEETDSGATRPDETPQPRPGIQFLRGLAMLSVGCLVFSESFCVGWLEFQSYRDQANVERLNRLVHKYQETLGARPDANLIELYRTGLSNRRIHPTPFGGYYRFDPKAGVVYNPNR